MGANGPWSDEEIGGNDTFSDGESVFTTVK